jgi:hypothetical protein
MCVFVVTEQLKLKKKMNFKMKLHDSTIYTST